MFEKQGGFMKRLIFKTLDIGFISFVIFITLSAYIMVIGDYYRL